MPYLVDVTQVRNLQTYLGSFGVSWSQITSIPATFTPSAHASTHLVAGSDSIYDQDLHTTATPSFNSVTAGNFIFLGHTSSNLSYWTSTLYNDNGIGTRASVNGIAASGDLYIPNAIQVAGGIQFSYSSTAVNLVWSNNHVLSLIADSSSPFAYLCNKDPRTGATVSNYTAYFGALDLGAVYCQYINPIGTTHYVTVVGTQFNDDYSVAFAGALKFASGAKLYDEAGLSGSSGQFMQVNSSGLPVWTSYSPAAWNGGTITTKLTTNLGTSSGGNPHWGLQTSSVARWQLGLLTAESGSNSGSDFNIWGYSDAGSFLGSWCHITRSSGAFYTRNSTLDDGSGNVTVAGNVTISNTGNNQISLGPNPSSGPSNAFIKYSVSEDYLGLFTWADGKPIHIGGSSVIFAAEGGSTRASLDSSGNLTVAGTLGVYGTASFAGSIGVGGTVAFSPYATNNDYCWLVWVNKDTLGLLCQHDYQSYNVSYSWNGTTYWLGALDCGAVFTAYINPIAGFSTITMGGSVAINGSLTMNGYGAVTLYPLTPTFHVGVFQLNSAATGGYSWQNIAQTVNLMTLDNSGNFAISGYVSSSLVPNGSSYQLGNGSYPWYGAVFSGSTGNGIYLLSIPAVTSAHAVVISGSGQIGYVSSSIKYKENIRELINCEWIYNLKPSRFDRKNKSSKGEMGLIAEEVLAVAPELVYLENGKPEAVHYDRLVIPLLVEIKNLRRELTELQTKLKGGD